MLCSSLFLHDVVPHRNSSTSCCSPRAPPAGRVLRVASWPSRRLAAGLRGSSPHAETGRRGAGAAAPVHKARGWARWLELGKLVHTPCASPTMPRASGRLLRAQGGRPRARGCSGLNARPSGSLWFARGGWRCFSRYAHVFKNYAVRCVRHKELYSTCTIMYDPRGRRSITRPNLRRRRAP
jgi:hypothetical protein